MEKRDTKMDGPIPENTHSKCADVMAVEALMAVPHVSVEWVVGGGWFRNAQTRQLSHPLPVLRAREIDQFARSREYKEILERGRIEAARRGRGLGVAK